MKTKSIKLITLILLFVHGSIFGCINGETKVLKNGLFIYEDHYGSIPFGHKFNRFNFEKVKKELDSLYKKTNDLDYLSDIGYVLIIEGKYVEALNLYLEIEKKSPNRYSTASNIGTIYELLGDNKKAYFWIEKGIQINPSSHAGSEWLHLKILEAKINAEKNLDSNFFFSTSFGTFNNPQTELSDAKIEKLISDTYYQLNERITFIKDNDIIIANLLFDLGNLCLIESKYHEALEILKMAKEYGLEVSATVDERYHLEKATEAACRYFIAAKNRLGSWSLAAASYNVGIKSVATRIEEQQVNSYYDLLLPEETARYVLRIVAVKEILENPVKYGFIVEKQDLYYLVPTKKIEIDSSVTNLALLAKSLGTNYKALKIQNPWLREKNLENKNKKVYGLEIPLEGY